MELARHALHAVGIYFKYKDEMKLFKAPLPHDFLPWIKNHFSLSVEELEEIISKELNNYFK